MEVHKAEGFHVLKHRVSKAEELEKDIELLNKFKMYLWSLPEIMEHRKRFGVGFDPHMKYLIPRYVKEWLNVLHVDI